MAETKAQASNRWIREGKRWEVDRYRKDKIRQAKESGMSQEAAREHAWQCCLAQFPPLGTDPETVATPAPLIKQETATVVSGLGNIPPDWPPLPANAALASEISWVQSERLYIVEETSSGATKVHLEKAHEPPPSRAALGWLETSIRSYAKYVDIAAKATSSQQDEAEHVHRERLAIEEMRELLRSMLPACPHCGKGLG